MSPYSPSEHLQIIPSKLNEYMMNKREEVLANVDCSVEMLTKSALDRILGDRTCTVRSGDDHFFHEPKPLNFEHAQNRYPVSTEEDPAIILAHGASFCSLVFAFDKKGSCVGLHQSIIPDDTDSGSIESMQSRIDAFNHQAEKCTDDDSRTLFLSGMNLSEGDEINSRQIALNGFVNSGLYGDRGDPRVVPVWVNSEQETLKSLKQKLIGNLCLTLTNIGRILEGKEVTRVPEYIHGAVFIPKYLSKDNMNHILLVDTDDASKMVRNELFIFGEI